MSAPEVGDRVRVIAGQWTGWEGVVRFVTGRCLTAALEDARFFVIYERALYVDEVEKVPTTPTDGHRGDETGADVLP